MSRGRNGEEYIKKVSEKRDGERAKIEETGKGVNEGKKMKVSEKSEKRE